MNKKLFWQGLGYAAGVAAYVTLVAWGMTRAEHWFGGQNPGLWGPALFLMLFCLSAAIVGSLLFGRPLYLVLAGKKTEALWQAATNITWLFVITALAFGLLAAVR
ncbi:MAG: hypothetical protein M1333_02075 [Patescibacteria group bacterium]|nr:hypothetical protein [Patescibacteria group bacterium]